jgi:hypothetical protein
MQLIKGRCCTVSPGMIRHFTHIKKNNLCTQIALVGLFRSLMKKTRWLQLYNCYTS